MAYKAVIVGSVNDVPVEMEVFYRGGYDSEKALDRYIKDSAKRPGVVIDSVKKSGYSKRIGALYALANYTPGTVHLYDSEGRYILLHSEAKNPPQKIVKESRNLMGFPLELYEEVEFDVAAAGRTLIVTGVMAQYGVHLGNHFQKDPWGGHPWAKSFAQRVERR